MNAQLQYQIEQFFYRKSELCDAQDWDAYLQLFAVDSEFHLPQWDSEHVYTRDPKREMSLIYYANRSGLEPVSYTHLRAHETPEHLVCRLLLEKKKKHA